MSSQSVVDRVHVDNLDSEGLARIGLDILAASVGTCFVFVGSEREVYAARSEAIASGAISEEVVVAPIDGEAGSDDAVAWSDGAEPRNLFCAHCHQTFTAVAGVGDAVTCPSCGLSLSVHYNFSRRRAAYLAKYVSKDSLVNRGSRP
ncbi:hypothetical protein EXE59_14655 [Nocardioides eburneiflavus]|uniref:Dimethylamine monooxygenase subunit DmmA-like C-terminal domain-containing protein n=1 Tax=Nocardioides eburneiflavus TaxID=2518372 RepID=A0A4Z1CHH3_9ACTN|nr:dimethylamine monooxygenase subunit DmmA family protein [Nocardioides eburneiflavus]TGN65067.1 hypothetical protein EXE59_14655 [Nocardioides eburneiflavus]